MWAGVVWRAKAGGPSRDALCVLTGWYVRFSGCYRGAVVTPVLLMARCLFIYLPGCLYGLHALRNSSTVLPLQRTTKPVRGVHVVKLNSDQSRVKQARTFPHGATCVLISSRCCTALYQRAQRTLQLTRNDFSLMLWWDDRQLPKHEAALFYLRISNAIRMCRVWLCGSVCTFVLSAHEKRDTGLNTSMCGDYMLLNNPRLLLWQVH